MTCATDPSLDYYASFQDNHSGSRNRYETHDRNRNSTSLKRLTKLLGEEGNVRWKESNFDENEEIGNQPRRHGSVADAYNYEYYSYDNHVGNEEYTSEYFTNEDNINSRKPPKQMEIYVPSPELSPDGVVTKIEDKSTNTEDNIPAHLIHANNDRQKERGNSFSGGQDDVSGTIAGQDSSGLEQGNNSGTAHRKTGVNAHRKTGGPMQRNTSEALLFVMTVRERDSQAFVRNVTSK